ncbi:STAS domain-containing protein [Streptomyces sp. NPDC047461]|uniref:STAS domain-containing protein n=1 Tax=Streptomyces sp. NPDC047461 TaxID=3155619 RepID=UPI003401FC6D
MADLSVETLFLGRCVVVRVSGAMDYQSDVWFRGRFRELIARGGRCFVLDLSGVPLCDSVGLNVLLGAWRQADAGGAVLVLACVPDPVRRLLELTGADQVLRMFDTVADAEAVFGG